MPKYNYKPGQVVEYRNGHPFHSWQNGLYVVIYSNSKVVWISQLRNYVLNVSGGKYDYSITGAHPNPCLFETPMSYKLDPELIPK